jgi:hypothetical protein
VIPVQRSQSQRRAAVRLSIVRGTLEERNMKNALAAAAAAGFILSASYGFAAGAATLTASAPSVTTIAATNGTPDQKDDLDGATSVAHFRALLEPSHPGDYDHSEY